MSLLLLDDLHVHYGAIHALKGVSIRVERGQIVTLVGANGAGKSTLLRTVSGLLRHVRGHVTWDGCELLGKPAQSIVQRGIVHVPEGRRIFGRMSVEENLALGAYLRVDAGEVAKDLEHCFALFPLLKKRLKQVAGTLSGGEQQMLAIARGLMARPRLLLLDEPSLGLAPLLVAEILERLVEIHREGVGILLVEQNAYAALSIAQHAFVLETGTVALRGPAAELLENPRVRAAYLGG